MDISGHLGRAVTVLRANLGKVTDGEIRVLIALAGFADQEGTDEVSITLRLLAEDADVSLPYALHSVQSLVLDGIIVPLPRLYERAPSRFALPMDFTARRARLRTEARAKLHA
jgi:hypothetical protein